MMMNDEQRTAKDTLDQLVDSYRSATTDGERTYVDGVAMQFVSEESNPYRASTFLLYYERNKVNDDE